jgi:hypothetical protein
LVPAAVQRGTGISSIIGPKTLGTGSDLRWVVDSPRLLRRRPLKTGRNPALPPVPKREIH